MCLFLLMILTQRLRLMLSNATTATIVILISENESNMNNYIVTCSRRTEDIRNGNTRETIILNTLCHTYDIVYTNTPIDNELFE